MPSKLSKVTKRVTKKKGTKINALHENSRDAQRLRRAGARDERVANMKSTKQKTNLPWLERVAFFQDRLPETLHPLNVEEMKDLVAQFLQRHDEELNALKAERRPGRPASNRQSLLEQAVKAEAQEFVSGFWLPNLQDVETLQKLDEWKGLWLGLGSLRFLRVQKDGEVKESQFPPRGAS
ncbi:Translation machinery-associated protein 16 [Fulvia fulva]|uniref:Translation machinery-associated protein 16 n=1 Tax=Passalora fulva TaxID=5499 RepID=A0A9Q8PJF8_PASFU|nr:Translation machinery-associated protein 16 [Fulvia fulva]KAK4612090.1 Translation machinery-associated protein 16 [Fulvia fulva]KAK4612794.1 Translation machinery-associated protein 16 [Fulvia fulva]UJO23578.1 Translation machinery-associated protein 16 [Fulvia fulva]WPV21542.1 Translation machinery-associated protein 16 [Fulvia fulva]WPV36310.1 Translation machinery-associated protein 16 [Fulvia fulva]